MSSNKANFCRSALRNRYRALRNWYCALRNRYCALRKGYYALRKGYCALRRGVAHCALRTLSGLKNELLIFMIKGFFGNFGVSTLNNSVRILQVVPTICLVIRQQTLVICWPPITVSPLMISKTELRTSRTLTRPTVDRISRIPS